MKKHGAARIVRLILLALALALLIFVMAFMPVQVFAIPVFLYVHLVL